MGTSLPVEGEGAIHEIYINIIKYLYSAYTFQCEALNNAFLKKVRIENKNPRTIYI